MAKVTISAFPHFAHAETNGMRFTPICLLLVGLMGCNATEQPAKPTATDKPNALQDAAIAAIRKLGGRVRIDTKSPDRPVTHVGFRRTQVTDAGVEELRAALPNRRIGR